MKNKNVLNSCDELQNEGQLQTLHVARMPGTMARYKKLLCYGGLLFFSVTGSILAEISKDESGAYPYNPLTVPLLAEGVKILLSAAFVLSDTLFDAEKFSEHLRTFSLKHFWLFAVPAACYYVSNTCALFIIAEIGLVQFHILSNLKILFSALAMRVILGRKLTLKQWFSLLVLASGILLAQSRRKDERKIVGKSHGYILVVISTMASSLGGVYSEKLLKDRVVGHSIHIKNIQLYTWGIFFGIFAFLQTGESIRVESLFRGYSPVVIVMLFVMSFSGLIVGLILKHFDSLARSFIASLAMVTSAWVQIFRGVDESSPRLAVSIVLICYALRLYESCVICI